MSEHYGIHGKLPVIVLVQKGEYILTAKGFAKYVQDHGLVEYLDKPEEDGVE